MARLTDPRCIQIFVRAVHTNERAVMVAPHPEHLLDPFLAMQYEGVNLIEPHACWMCESRLNGREIREYVDLS